MERASRRRHRGAPAESGATAFACERHPGVERLEAPRHRLRVRGGRTDSWDARAGGRLRSRAIHRVEGALDVGIRLAEEVRLEPGGSDRLVAHELFDLVALDSAGGEDGRVGVAERVPHLAAATQAGRLVGRFEEELGWLPFLQGLPVFWLMKTNQVA